MPANASKQDDDRELTITRVYDAPARLLFQAWSRPEHLMKWFGPAAMKDEYVGMGIEAGAGSGLDQVGDVVAGMKIRGMVSHSDHWAIPRQPMG